MPKTQLTDAKVRERIARELDKNFFVEAGAGSGKTHSLVERMVGLVRYSLVKMEHIVAVTFTRKAAAELRQRFQIELEMMLHTSGLGDKERDNIEEALSSFERTSISTIHSFCARLLRERPVEAGIDPGFDEIEEDDDKIFAEEVWAEYLEKQGFENNKLISWMQEKGIAPDSLKGIYMILVRYPDVEVVREDVARPDFHKEKEKAQKFLLGLRKEMPKDEPQKGWDILQAMVRRGLKLISLGYLGEDRLFITLLNILKKEPAITQNRWPEGNGKNCQEAMLKFQELVVTPALKTWSEYLHKPLIEFVLEGVKYYEHWRMERSVLNFQDLLMRTAKLLRENEEVRGYFKKSIAYLMVDEFQDTDPIQAEIVMLLTGEDNSVSKWRKVKPKRGSLFLVGDPKQSIYRFRRADIDIYNQAKNIFKEGAGEVLELTSNFRSFEPIRDLTNTVFKDIFPQEDTRYQAKFAPLMTVNEKSEGYLCGIFENTIPKVSGNKTELVAQQDACIIAGWINQCLNGRVRLERTEDEKKHGERDEAKPGDFMIITKVKARLPIYARALEAMGIPYEISGGENFSQSEELYEIYKVLKATADSRNSVALLAALRGLFFGISDNDLYAFVRGGGNFSYFSQPKKGPENIREAFARLREYNEIAMNNTPLTAIEKIMEKLGMIPLAISQEMGSSRAGNVLKTIELLRGRKYSMTGSFVEMVDYIKDLREKKGIEEMSLSPNTVKAVRLMNLHKAKGLEASVVILADPIGVSGDYEPKFHIVRTQDSSLGYFAITRPISEYRHEFIGRPKGWAEHAAEEKLYESAEDKRLDYVAITRAKNILVVSTYREGEKAKCWQSLYTYLQNMPKIAVTSYGEPAKREVFEINREKWAEEKAKMIENVKEISLPSYHAGSVTGLIEKTDIFVGDPADGASWGRVVHRAMEMCGKGNRDRLKILARSWLVEEDRAPEELERLLKLVDGIMETKIWQRMLKAKEKYFEVPFSTMINEKVITGAIDLIFREVDGWVIVDYKTDDFEKDPKKKTAYEKQLSLYAEFWEKITGDKVKETFLCRGSL